MIVSIQDALDYLKADIPEKELRRKINAVESLIRDETANNFQECRMRFYAPAAGGVIKGNSPYLSIGDSIEIGESINEGIYTVEAIMEAEIGLDHRLYDTQHNMITKIVYPEAVKAGVLNMLQWELNMRSKTGIKSDRKSVV